jgi:hypothetical protein
MEFKKKGKTEDPKIKYIKSKTYKIKSVLKN